MAPFFWVRERRMANSEILFAVLLHRIMAKPGCPPFVSQGTAFYRLTRGSFREARTWLNVCVNCCCEGYCYRRTRLISPLRAFRSSCCSLGRSGRRSFRRLVGASSTITAMVN